MESILPKYKFLINKNANIARGNSNFKLNQCFPVTLASVFLSCSDQLKLSNSYSSVAIGPLIFQLVSLHYDYLNFSPQSVQGHTPVFLPRESQRQRSLVGCRLWGHTVRHNWSDLAAAAAAAAEFLPQGITHYPDLHFCFFLPHLKTPLMTLSWPE